MWKNLVEDVRSREVERGNERRVSGWIWGRSRAVREESKQEVLGSGEVRRRREKENTDGRSRGEGGKRRLCGREVCFRRAGG